MKTEWMVKNWSLSFWKYVCTNKLPDIIDNLPYKW